MRWTKRALGYLKLKICLIWETKRKKMVKIEIYVNVKRMQKFCYNMNRQRVRNALFFNKNYYSVFAEKK